MVVKNLKLRIINFFKLGFCLSLNQLREFLDGGTINTYCLTCMNRDHRSDGTTTQNTIMYNK